MATKKAKAKKAKRAAATAAPSATRKTASEAVKQFNPEHRIHLLVKENPKRKGSKEAKRFDKYRNGMTVEQAKAAGMDNLNLTRDVMLGYIKVG
jgi:hypothetical protein